MKTLLVNAILAIILPAITRGQTVRGIDFKKFHSWAEVRKKAKEERKCVFVDVYTTWCRPCKEMDARIYTDSALGHIMNDKYISIKVQMDQKDSDEPLIKSWYSDAEQLKASEKIEAFPTLLFYSPDGDLLIKTIGFKDANAISTIANFSANPQVAAQFNSDLQAYKVGRREYDKMVSLNRTVKQILQDDKLALRIANDYNEGYLRKLNDQEYFTSDHLTFIREYGVKLVNVNDKFFAAAYFDPQKIDSILGPGTSSMYINPVITKDEIENKIYKDGKPNTNKPNWNKFKKRIKRQYPKVDADELILNAKISFYANLKDWQNYTKYKSESIKLHPPKPGGLDVFFALNEPAWNVFLNASDSISLKRALAWSDQALHIEPNVQYLDTKANILYKLGKIKEAIALQEKALIQDQEEAAKLGNKYQFAYISENLEKMKKGQPTWITNN